MNTSGRFLKRICERVKKLDILAPEVGLSVQGDSGVKSYIGVMLSFACIGLFVGASIYGTLESLRTDRPSVVQESSSSSVYPQFDLLKDQKFPAIMMVSPNGPVKVEEIYRYATILAFKETRQFVDNDITKTPITKYDFINMKPCKEYTDDERLRFGAPKTQIETSAFNLNGLCPEIKDINNNLTITGKSSDPFSENILIMIYPCAVEFAPEGCASADEISNSGALLLPNLMNIDLSNYKEPITSSYNTDLDFAINPSFVQQVTTRLKMVEVWNSNGMFTEDAVVVSQSDFSTQRSQYLFRDPTKLSCSAAEFLVDPLCTPYILFTVSSSGLKTSFTRGYKGALEIIGDIGGIRDIIFTLGFYLYVLYNDREVKKRLVAQVYSIDSIDKQPHLNKSVVKGNAATNQSQTEPQPSKWRCCKMTYPSSLVSPSTGEHEPSRQFDEDEAYEQIEKNLDVVNLIRKLNFIEVLLKFFRIEDEQQMNCVSQASYSLGQRGVGSAMAGLRVVGVGVGLDGSVKDLDKQKLDAVKNSQLHIEA